MAATFVAYAHVLQQQAPDLGEGPVGLFGALRGAPTWFVGVLAATFAADAAAIWIPAGRGRRWTLFGTAVALTLTGVVAIFSVGLPLIVAAGISAGAAATDPSIHGGAQRAS